MGWSTAALPSSGSQRVSSTAFSSQVHKNELDGWWMLSPLCSQPQIVNRTHVCLRVHDNLRGSRGSSVVNVRPIFKANAAIDDSSSHLPDSAEAEHATKDHPPRKDGLLQWLRNAVAKRSAQKEEYISKEPTPMLYHLVYCLSNMFGLTNSLKRYGLAGILAYGLLNTIYYLGAFLFVWLYVAPSPGNLGFVPAARRFLQVFATVWAGSQVTKLFRAAGALSLAPFVDRGLDWCTQKFNFRSRGRAFSFAVGACFGLAALLFLVITTMWS